MEDTKIVTTTNPEETPKDTPKEPDKPEGTTVEPKKEEPKEKQPDVQELMVEIAKLKRQADKNASEAKEWKEKFRSTQSEKEILDAEKAEAQAKRDEEFADMKRRLEINDLAENFMDLGYSKDLAKKAATAQIDGDTAALLGFQKQFNELQKKNWEEEFIASRPEINVGSGGNGGTITKEQFDAMTLVEKSKLRKENKAEYDRLIAL